MKICTLEKDSGVLNIDCGILQCSFFPGHLFPVFFRVKGITLPSISFRDMLECHGNTYFAFEERWGKREIVLNNAETAQIKTMGHFCRCDTPEFVEAMKELEYITTYTFQRNSSTIVMELKLSGCTKEAITARLCLPVWRISKETCASSLQGNFIQHESFSTTNPAFNIKTQLNVNP